jgi:hypothetical protein
MLIIIRDILIILYLILCWLYIYKDIEYKEKISKQVTIISEQLQIDDISIIK